MNWFEEHGVVFHDVLSVVATNPDSFRTWHLYEGMGAQAFSTLADEALKNDVELLLETTALNLLMEGDACTGLVCENESEGLIAIDAKAVIICTGGYGDNQDMMNFYLIVGMSTIWLILGCQRITAKASICALLREQSTTLA